MQHLLDAGRDVIAVSVRKVGDGDLRIGMNVTFGHHIGEAVASRRPHVDGLGVSHAEDPRVHLRVCGTLPPERRMPDLVARADENDVRRRRRPIRTSECLATR